MLFTFSFYTSTPERNRSSFTESSTTRLQFNIGSAWEINEEDYQRYEDLEAGPRDILSPNIDPLTALGIEARNDTERRHYAELWVKDEYERSEKELKFQREVDAA